MTTHVEIARTGARHPALEGAIAGIPLTLAILPFAFTIGAVIADADVDALAAWAGSFMLFGGAAQLAAIEVTDAGASVAIAAATAIAINARFAVYGPGLARWFTGESRWMRGLLAAQVVDQTYLVCASRFERGDLDRRARRAFYLGVAVPQSVVWIGAQALGLVLRDSLPGVQLLELAPALLFAGLLAASVRSRAMARPALVAGAVTLGGIAVIGPAALGLGIVAAAAIGGRT